MSRKFWKGDNIFISFEGIDGSGKTTLSQLVAQKINIVQRKSLPGDPGLRKELHEVLPAVVTPLWNDFFWTKEPTFSSEQADRLNLNGMDSVHREIEFLIDRIAHQDCLRGAGMYEPARGTRNVVCDRYVWSGLAYCKVFNPSVYDFVAALYSHRYFMKPDLYVFVDTPPEVCCQRRRVPGQYSNMVALLEAYKATEPIINKESAVYTVDGTEDLEGLTDELVELISRDPYMQGEKNEPV